MRGGGSQAKVKRGRVSTPQRGESRRSAPIGSLDWPNVLPFRADASSDRLEWVSMLPGMSSTRQGQIRASDVNADYTVRPDPEETLAQLRALSANSERQRPVLL